MTLDQKALAAAHWLDMAWKLSGSGMSRERFAEVYATTTLKSAGSDTAKRELAALSAPEPVAWRVKYYGEYASGVFGWSEWMLTQLPEFAAGTVTDNLIAEPLGVIGAPSLYASPPSHQGLREAFDTHAHNWRKAMLIAQQHAEVSPPDIDDKSYWAHEIAVLDRAALQSQPASGETAIQRQPEQRTCPYCRGKGTEADYVGPEMTPYASTCSHCNGEGVDPDYPPAQPLLKEGE